MQKAVHHIKKNLIPSFPAHFRLGFLGLGIFSFLCFAAFTVMVKSKHLRPFDFDMTVRIQGHIPHKFDDFFSFLSVIGRFETSIVILLLVLIFRKKIMGLLVIMFFALGHLIEIVGKSFLTQPPPPHMFLRTTTLSTNFPGLYIDASDSYPSGHAMRVIFISVVVILILYRSTKLPAYLKYSLIGAVVVYAFLMTLSRVSLGEHWTTDVIGGSLLGLSFSFFSLLFL